MGAREEYDALAENSKSRAPIDDIAVSVLTEDCRAVYVLTTSRGESGRGWGVVPSGLITQNSCQ
jgi:hypothetical protein